MLFVREDISRKLLSAENYPMDSFYIEDNYEKLNGCFYKCSYNPIRCKNYFYLENLNEGSTLYSSHFENFNIIGNFDVKAKDRAISIFSDTYDLQSLTKEPNLLTLTLFWLINRKVY